MGAILTHDYKEQDVKRVSSRYLHTSIINGDVDGIYVSTILLTQRGKKGLDEGMYNGLSPLHTLVLASFINQPQQYKNTVNAVLTNYSFRNILSKNAKITLRYLRNIKGTCNVSVNKFPKIVVFNTYKLKHDIVKTFTIDGIDEYALITILLDLATNYFLTGYIKYNLHYLVEQLHSKNVSDVSNLPQYFNSVYPNINSLT